MAALPAVRKASLCHPPLRGRAGGEATGGWRGGLGAGK